jgi:hypothetical protein
LVGDVGISDDLLAVGAGLPPEAVLRCCWAFGDRQAEGEGDEVGYAVSGAVALAANHRAQPSVVTQDVAVMKIEVDRVALNQINVGEGLVSALSRPLWCLQLPDLRLAPRATIGPARLRMRGVRGSGEYQVPDQPRREPALPSTRGTPIEATGDAGGPSGC